MAKKASIAWGLLILSLAANASLARAQATVGSLANRLELTESGAGRWLEALGVHPGRPAAETLLVVSGDGSVVATRAGVESSVSLGLDVDLRLLTPGSGLVLIHNHPHSASLSGNDVLQLSKPGVMAVVAIGHDRSIYMASRGPRYDAGRFEDLQYLPTRAQVTKRLRIECGAGAIRQSSADAHFSHLVMLALAKASVIEYLAVLSSAAHESFEPARPAFNRIAAGAAR